MAGLLGVQVQPLASNVVLVRLVLGCTALTDSLEGLLQVGAAVGTGLLQVCALQACICFQRRLIHLWLCHLQRGITLQRSAVRSHRRIATRIAPTPARGVGYAAGRGGQVLQPLASLPVVATVDHLRRAELLHARSEAARALAACDTGNGLLL